MRRGIGGWLLRQRFLPLSRTRTGREIDRVDPSLLRRCGIGDLDPPVLTPGDPQFGSAGIISEDGRGYRWLAMRFGGERGFDPVRIAGFGLCRVRRRLRFSKGAGHVRKGRRLLAHPKLDVRRLLCLSFGVYRMGALRWRRGSGDESFRIAASLARRHGVRGRSEGGLLAEFRCGLTLQLRTDAVHQDRSAGGEEGSTCQPQRLMGADAPAIPRRAGSNGSALASANRSTGSINSKGSSDMPVLRA